MDMTTKKNVKNALTTVGTVVLAAKVPALVIGAAAGAVLANPKKAKAVLKDGFDKAMDFVEELMANNCGDEPENIEDLITEEDPFVDEEDPVKRGDWNAT